MFTRSHAVIKKILTMHPEKRILRKWHIKVLLYRLIHVELYEKLNFNYTNICWSICLHLNILYMLQVDRQETAPLLAWPWICSNSTKAPTSCRYVPQQYVDSLLQVVSARPICVAFLFSSSWRLLPSVYKEWLRPRDKNNWSSEALVTSTRKGEAYLTLLHSYISWWSQRRPTTLSPYILYIHTKKYVCNRSK